MNTVVKLDGLIKKYDNKAVVDGLSLEIKEGEIFGLLGPNGAGKSTTMNMICSLLKPTAGDIRLFDLDVKKDKNKIKPMIGYIPQDLAISGRIRKTSANTSDTSRRISRSTEDSRPGKT